MSQTKKILLIILTMTLAAFGAYAFVFLKVREASTSTDEIGREIEEVLQKQRHAESQRGLFESTEKKRTELFQRLPSRGVLDGFFEELEALAREAEVGMKTGHIVEGVALDQIVPKAEEGSDEKPKPKANPASSELEWLSVDMQATGSWESVYRFLSFVELLPYHISLSNIKISQGKITESSSSSDEDGTIKLPSGNWELTLTAKILLQKEK